MNSESLEPAYPFLNPGRILCAAREIVQHARMVWQTELWLDPIERHITNRGVLTTTQSKLVHEELSFAFGHLIRMAEGFLDLSRRLVDSGAATMAHDGARQLIASLPDSRALHKRILENRGRFAEILQDVGLPQSEFDALFDRTIGSISQIPEEGDLTVMDQAIVYSGRTGARFLREVAEFPRVAGNVWISGGLLASFETEDTPSGAQYDTDLHHAVLAITKAMHEHYRTRVKTAEISGLSPHPQGIDPFTAWFVTMIFAYVALASLVILCGMGSLPKQACEVLLPVVQAAAVAATAKTCEEFNKTRGGSCTLKDLKSTP